MSRFPAPSSVAKKDRTFNAVLQPVLLRRTGRSVTGWDAWRREGAFGLAPAGGGAVGALGWHKGEHPGAGTRAPPVLVKSPWLAGWFEWNGDYQCEASIPGLAGNLLSLRPSRAQQGQSLALAFRRFSFTRWSNSYSTRVEVHSGRTYRLRAYRSPPPREDRGRPGRCAVPGRARRGRRGCARSNPLSVTKAISRIGIPTAGAPQREDFINAGE